VFAKSVSATARSSAADIPLDRPAVKAFGEKVIDLPPF